MINPGSIAGQIPAGDDALIRRIQDLERAMRELAAQNPLATAGLVPSPNLLTVNGGLNVNGAMAVTGTLSLPAGIIGNDALTSPVTPGVVYASATNFAVTTTETAIIAGYSTVPSGFTQAVISLTGRIYAVNGTAASDYLFGKTTIATHYGYGLPSQVAAGGTNINVSPFAYIVTGLTGGSTIPITLTAKSQTANWAANGANTAEIAGSILWFR
jgi:hypothetical protein